MKTFEIKIPEYLVNDFFAPIRKKTDFIKVAALASRLLLLGNQFEFREDSPTMRLVIDKMSRLFFYKAEKYYSISYPFFAKINPDEPTLISEISSYEGITIDSKTISEILAIINVLDSDINASLISIFIDENYNHLSGISILEHLYQTEPGYFRFDNDLEHENGDIHPLNHLDINYSQYSTFKVGLKNQISWASFEDIPNVTTNCSYLIPGIP